MAGCPENNWETAASWITPGKKKGGLISRPLSPRIPKGNSYWSFLRSKSCRAWRWREPVPDTGSQVPLLEEGLVVFLAQARWDKMSSVNVQQNGEPGNQNFVPVSDKLLFLVWFRLSETLGCITNSDKGHAKHGAGCRMAPQRNVSPVSWIHVFWPVWGW